MGFGGNRVPGDVIRKPEFQNLLFSETFKKSVFTISATIHLWWH
jgi:hypothetical protein